MAFPWDNLITAVSTLTAGLGGVGLRGRYDRRNQDAEASRQDALSRADRLGAAYADLVTTAMDMQLHFDQMVALRLRYLPEHHESVARARQGEEPARQLARAVSMVQLIGSDAAREAAGFIYNATVEFGRTLDPREVNREDANAAGIAMFVAIDAFLDAVRPETAGQPAGPVKRRRLRS